MKRLAKMLALTCFAALALAAVSAAGASASTFTASEFGTLTGTATSTQVFKVTATGTESVTCAKATMSGELTSLDLSQLHFTVNYEECIAHTSVGTFSATVTPATYLFTADKTIHISNPIVIHIPALGCTTEVGPQTLGGIEYTNEVSGSLVVHRNNTGIVSTSTGICPSGTTGTYTGSNTVERVGGGTVSWDA